MARDGLAPRLGFFILRLQPLELTPVKAYTCIMDTHSQLDALTAAALEAVAQFQCSLIAQAEALVAAWRAALPQCLDADGNLLENWQDILANPLDPPRG